MRKIILITLLLLTTVILGRNLNPASSSMFEFHDITQPARILEFTNDLRHLQIPPRNAADFSFGLGYPVFNFYAPSSYWITSVFSLTGFDPINALKLSFILSMAVAFIFTYLFLRYYFDFYSSLAGAMAYVTSLYFAIDIFIRGNLAETWFLALLPASLFVLTLNSKNANRRTYLLTIFIVFLILTVHNLLSLLSIPVLLLYIFLQKNRKRNSVAFILAAVLASYFFVPMFFESPLTYATTVAKLTNYRDHFLCAYQLWQSPWGYGGSIPGCNDGMSFKLGKLQIILFVLGTIFFIYHRRKKTGSKLVSVFFLILTLASLFLTTYQSQFFWDLTSPISSLIQFPWRFIAFSLIGMSFFTSFFVHSFSQRWRFIIAGVIIVSFFVANSSYFYHPPLTKTQFEQKYLSPSFIKNEVAYKIAEYLPRTADYQAWRNDENKPITIKIDHILPITYFPYWHITINGQTFIPHTFDGLGRPIVTLEKPALVTITYEESGIEKLGDFLTLVTFIFLCVVFLNKKLWNRITN